MRPDKRYFVSKLREQLVREAAVSKRSEDEAREAARTLATESEKKEDGRAALEFGSLATGQGERVQRILADIGTLDAFCQRGLRDFTPDSPVGLGAIVEVATEDREGPLERTFILLPVGAATELEGPGGDGFLTVLTPASPVGRALMGKRRGEVADVTLRQEPYEWEILGVF